MWIFLFFCVLLFCAVRALPPGSGSISVSVDKPNYETGDTVLVSLSNPIGISEADLHLIIRKCNALLPTTCEEDVYKTWRDDRPAATTSSATTSTSLTIDHTWPAGDYHISVESPSFGKVTQGQSSQNFIYGMSQRFRVTFTAGRLFIREPRAGAMWTFDTETKVTWQAQGFNGGEVISGTITNAEGQVHPLSGVEQMATGGEMAVIPAASWGVGLMTIRLAYASNDAIFATRQVNVVAPPAYFEITEPTSATGWNSGDTVLISFVGHNVPPEAPVIVMAEERGNSRTEMIAPMEAGLTAGSGGVMWSIPTSIQYTSSDWTIVVASPGMSARGTSDKFQISSSIRTGICEIKKLGSEMNLHDEAVCKNEPFIVSAGGRRVTAIKFEWLYCLDDRMRVTVVHDGTGGTRTTEVSKKIGGEPIRRFVALENALDGGDLHIELVNLQRGDAADRKTLQMDVFLYPYDTIAEPEGPAPVEMQNGLLFETLDPECNCPYEVELDHPRCQAVDIPCVEDDDPRCNGPCKENDLRVECTEQLFPRQSVYTPGTKVCSMGPPINVHRTHCQQPDDLMYTVQRTVTELEVLSETEQPGCDLMWLNVMGPKGSGWIHTNLVSLCREVDNNVFVGDAASSIAMSWTALFFVAAFFN